MTLTGKISITETSYYPLEPELYTNHHNVAFKGKKDEKVRVVKTHMGVRFELLLCRTVCQDNIQPASDSNSASKSDSDSDSDRVELIVGSSSNSSELNDSRDQAADSIKKRYLRLVRLDKEGKGH